MKEGNRRFVIIGGGISGMAAALLLARHGYSITIVEKQKQLGSVLRGFSRQGVHFDTGLHYAGGLDENGVLTRYLRLLGIDDLPLVDFDHNCFDRLRFIQDEVEVSLPMGHERLVTSLSQDFPADAPFIANFFNRIRESFQSSTFLNFKGSLKEAIDSSLHQESLHQVLVKGTSNLVLRTVLSIHSVLYGVSPEEIPFVQHARIVGSYLEGVRTIRGGGKVLADSFEKRLTEEGVAALCGVGVQKLRFSSAGLVDGVILDDERFLRADGVLFTAHPAFLPAMLGKHQVKTAFLHRFASLKDTFSTYTLFGKSEVGIATLQGSNLLICPKTEIASAFRPDCRVEDGPFYITSSFAAAGCIDQATSTRQKPFGVTAFAPGDANELAAWHNSRPGKRPKGYLEFKRQRLESLRNMLVGFCPELTNVCFLAGGTPLTNRDYLKAPGCGLYGSKHSLHQFSPLPVTRIPNLWMAGQSVIAPGVLGAIISAFIACGFVLGAHAIQKELAACT